MPHHCYLPRTCASAPYPAGADCEHGPLLTGLGAELPPRAFGQATIMRDELIILSGRGCFSHHEDSQLYTRRGNDIVPDHFLKDRSLLFVWAPMGS